jgi:EAL domain-containing protein (putative c-di-GMP-specific phosphodiesterase class I)/GGDEF domain-containing protein
MATSSAIIRPPSNTAAAMAAGNGTVDPEEQLLVLVVGGPSRLVGQIQSMLSTIRGGYAFGFVPVDGGSAGLDRLARGGFDAAIVFDDLTGRVLMRGLAERALTVPAVCLVERIEHGERAKQRSRMREQGAAACVFAEELSGPVLEAVLLHAIEQSRADRAARSGKLATADDDAPGMLNAGAFMQRLDAAVARSMADDAHRFTLVWMDAGPLRSLLGMDRSLRRKFSQRVFEAARGHAVARVCDDELAVLIDAVTDANDLAVLSAIKKAVAQPFEVGDEPVYIDVSLGIARGRARDGSAEVAMDRARADARVASMPAADAAALSGVHDVVRDRGPSLDEALRNALERNEFAVAYQPIVELDRGKLLGFEALIRWNHPDGSQRSAGEFIAEAERSELILGIGYWVLEAATRQMAQWEAEFELDGRIAMSVNLSPRQVTDPRLCDRVRSLLMTTGLTPKALCFEVQSRSVMASRREASSLITGLAGLGCQVWIEDFGQTDCDIDHLRGLPLAALKIDREIVARLDGTEMTSGRVKHITDAAKAMRIPVFAEGVENSMQANVLRWLGCTKGQGYLHARPMPVGEAYGYLARFT